MLLEEAEIWIRKCISSAKKMNPRMLEKSSIELQDLEQAGWIQFLSMDATLPKQTMRNRIWGAVIDEMRLMTSVANNRRHTRGDLCVPVAEGSSVETLVSGYSEYRIHPEEEWINQLDAELTIPRLLFISRRNVQWTDFIVYMLQDGASKTAFAKRWDISQSRVSDLLTHIRKAYSKEFPTCLP